MISVLRSKLIIRSDAFQPPAHVEEPPARPPDHAFHSQPAERRQVDDHLVEHRQDFAELHGRHAMHAIGILLDTIENPPAIEGNPVADDRGDVPHGVERVAQAAAAVSIEDKRENFLLHQR